MGMETHRNSTIVVYHDETKDVKSGKYKGHIFFFVPQLVNVSHGQSLFGQDTQTYNPTSLLCEKIDMHRKEYGLATEKLHYTEISGRKWGKSDNGYRTIMEIAVDALRHKFSETFKQNPLSCKIAVMFYPKEYKIGMYGGNRKEQQLRHDETVMRMLLKGAMHFLYDDSNDASISTIYTDGQPDFRPLDGQRVIKRLQSGQQYGTTPLRDYVDFAKDAQIIPINSNHTKHDITSEGYKHANLLQIADFLLGGVIRSCYSNMTIRKNLPNIGAILKEQDKKEIVATPVAEMLDKRKRGAGFKSSGHYKSFTLSELTFENSKPEFKELKTQTTIFQNTPEFDFGF